MTRAGGRRRAYDDDNADVRFGGYLGAEFRNITFPGERAAAVRTLLAYQVYERDDRVLRALAKSSPAAVAFDIGTAASQSDGAFNRYDAALSSVIAINSRAFAAAVGDGQGGAGWDVGFPAGVGRGPRAAGARGGLAAAGRVSLRPGFAGCAIDGRRELDRDATDRSRKWC